MGVEKSPHSVKSASSKSPILTLLTSFSPVYQIKRVENHPVFNETVNCELSCNPDKDCESSSQLVLISFLLNSEQQEQK